MQRQQNGYLIYKKNALRHIALAKRKNQQGKQKISQQVCTKLLELSEYRNSRTVMWYLDIGSELRTKQTLSSELASDKKIAIPYCVGTDLHLWLLQSMDELQPGSYGILEPPKGRWQEQNRRVDIAQLDLVVLPGLGFDLKGHRLGHGQGYYDKLLSQVSPYTRLIALGYQSQVFKDIPAAPHDIPMHMLITEKHIYHF